MEGLYRICYYAGVQTLRLFHRTGRFFTLLFLPVRLLIRRIAQALHRRRGARVRQGLAGLRRCFGKAAARVREAWQRHPLLGMLQALCLPVAAAKRYRGLTKGVITLAAAAGAVALLFGTLRYWGQTTFALALTNENGNIWGYVAEETVL